MIASETDYKSAISLINKLLKYDKLSDYNKQELLKQRSGIKAEKEIAYSLSAYFKNKKDIIVINNLKINHNGSTAQVDHLVISRKAMYFIESKAISEQIEINEFDEWSRTWNGETISTDSPIFQVEQQKKIILQFMNDHLPEFREKLLGFQGQIGYYPSHIFVAISEKGKITGKGRKKYKDTVMKHDKIPRQLEKLEKSSLIKTITLEKYFLNQKEIKKLADLFLKFNINKQPVEKTQSWIANKIPNLFSNVTPQKKCGKCNKNTLIIKWGKYGYYFICASCNKTFTIKESCPLCGKPAKIKKDKESNNDRQSYDIICPVCGFKQLYFSDNSQLSKIKQYN